MESWWGLCLGQRTPFKCRPAPRCGSGFTVSLPTVVPRPCMNCTRTSHPPPAHTTCRTLASSSPTAIPVCFSLTFRRIHPNLHLLCSHTTRCALPGTAFRLGNTLQAGSLSTPGQTRRGGPRLRRDSSSATGILRQSPTNGTRSASISSRVPQAGRRCRPFLLRPIRLATVAAAREVATVAAARVQATVRRRLHLNGA
jgi:hypothetical protein